jgi:hypothetical protein
VENYFNYFTEIEEHYHRRRGATLLLSTLDWALIETWKDAGVPLQAVLRGIDDAFDKYEQRPTRSQKINSLAYCAQAVLSATEEMKEAAVGASREESETRGIETTGFEPATVAAFLRRNATQLRAANLPERTGISGGFIAKETADTLERLSTQLDGMTSEAGETISPKRLRMEDLERQLSVLEDKLFAILSAVAPDEEILAVRTQADRELAPYRSKMPAAQLEQLLKQYTYKRLLERYGLPRLSLFYM